MAGRKYLWQRKMAGRLCDSRPDVARLDCVALCMKRGSEILCLDQI